MPRVFFAEPNPRYQIGAAEEYGRITYLLEQPANPFSTETVITDFQEALKRMAFNPANDLVCLTGIAMTTALLLATIAAECPVVRLLMFDARTSSYRERVIKLTGKDSSNGKDSMADGCRTGCEDASKSGD